MVKDKILLVSGPHANERCAPLVAEMVYQKLLLLHGHVEHLRIPYKYTLLANLDDPENAVPGYCMPKSGGGLDMDLDTIVGDEVLRCKFPDSTVFEFHNSRDVWKKFGIDPRKPIEEYEIGIVMPVFTRPYEIGTWRNVSPDGIPGKYVIEAPAVSVAVPPERIEARKRRLNQLAQGGYTFEAKLIEFYLTHEADIQASREKGLISDCIAGKIVGWILSVLSKRSNTNSGARD